MSESRSSSVFSRSEATDGVPDVRAASRPTLAPIDMAPSFKQQAYAAMKNATMSMDVYGNREDIRLDERKLAQDFGISRTPVREALAQLERARFLRPLARRGVL